MYCTNPHQPTAMQNLLADVVEACGGSRQLLKILNRIGCVSSPDTHDRFVTYHAEQQRNKSVWEEIPQSVFTVGSADNFDMLQSYSAVNCGDQQRSYHGTTVQLVQPKSVLCFEEINADLVTLAPSSFVADNPSSAPLPDNTTSSLLPLISNSPSFMTESQLLTLPPCENNQTSSRNQTAHLTNLGK